VTAIGRRTLLQGAAAAIAFPLVIAARDGPAGTARFAPPSTPMLYTRRLERGLVGGASLVVTRRFAVRIVRDGDRFRIEGEQVDVEVEAPPQLEALARLERERVEAALFPLELDAAGAIRTSAQAADSAQLDAAVREATAQIERGPHAPDERAEMHAFVEAVQRNSAALVTELPRDLFAPVELARNESRAVALPGLPEGRVSLRFTAERDPATGLMRAARREIVTEIAGDTRRTVESWTLAPLEP
jgi:hypothetical protein